MSLLETGITMCLVSFSMERILPGYRMEIIRPSIRYIVEARALLLTHHHTIAIYSSTMAMVATLLKWMGSRRF